MVLVVVEKYYLILVVAVNKYNIILIYSIMFNLNKKDLSVYLTDAKSINVEDIINEGYFDLSLFERKKIYRNVTDIYDVRVISTYQKLLKKILRKDNEFSINKGGDILDILNLIHG